MKTLLPLILILVLAVACTSVPKEKVSSNEANPTATLTLIRATKSSPSAIQVSSPTPTSTIARTATPSLTPIPAPTFPPECGISKLGKHGTQKLNDSDAPSVLIQGTAILCTNNVILTGNEVFTIDQQAMLDLDTGKADPEHADVVFDVFGSMNFYSISGFNDVAWQNWSLVVEGHQVQYPPQPTYKQCKAQYVNPDQQDNEPAYLCVITNEGHVSRVKVEKFNPIDSVQSMEISFVTWSEVVAHP